MANPQQIIATLRQKPQMAIGGIAVLVVVLIGIIWLVFGGSQDDSNNPCSQKIDYKDQKTLAKTDSVGKAIEIQALLARAGITLDRADGEGGKADLVFRKDTTVCDRDKALITLVQSGLMDRNIGLESFDKGDLTASREEKRIKLIRAQQGELARLIRKISPIQDASVSLSIPEPTIFRRNKSKMSASVQVSVGSGTRLEHGKVRAIINLMVGSIQGLDAAHVALSDTNGNTYNSVLNSDTDMAEKLQERDRYMKGKVANQLDKLLGSGNYVVTVSTQLRETTREVMTQRYDPNEAAVSSRQRFTEDLNAKSGSSSAGGIASNFVPNMLKTSESGGGSNRGYKRIGEEVSYANTKTQTLETRRPGMVEDISIAITIDEHHYPKTVNKFGERVEMSTNDLRRLIAHAASPLVRPESVSVARVSFQDKLLPVKTHAPSTTKHAKDNSWMLWAVLSTLAVVIVSGSILLFRGRPKDTVSEQHQMEIQQLQELAQQQQQQLQANQQQTQQLLEARQHTPLDAPSQAPGQIPMQAMPPQPQQKQQAPQQPQQPQQPAMAVADTLKQTLTDLKNTMDDDPLDDDQLDMEIKSWIETT